MAGDWIKMSVGLRSHPKVIRMASALRADKLRVIGGLFAVWGVFDTHSADGLLEGYSLAAMDDELGWRGFGAAMQSIGWLIESESGLEAPRFDEHNGASAKRRAMENERKRNARKGDECPPNVVEMSACDADKPQTPSGPEKRREEKNSPSLRSGEDAQKRAARKCPDAFDLSPELRSWATEHHPTVNLTVETEKFRDHTFKTAMTDWAGAWRNWIRKAGEFGASGRQPSGKHAGFTSKNYREGVAEDGSLV